MKKNSFFYDIYVYEKFKNICTAIDWLLMDNKFKCEWNKKKLGNKFTNKIKKMPKMRNDSIIRGKVDSTHSVEDKIIIEMIETSVPIYENILKHIRNGIAHGSSKAIKINNTAYIEILDYNSNRTKQTAFIHMPLLHLNIIYKEYEKLIISEKPKQKEGEFFQKIKNNENIIGIILTIDLLFDEQKFDNKWNASCTKKLTRRLKELINTNDKFQIKEALGVYESNDDKNAKNMLRHMRNGIAHGRAKIFKKRGKYFVEIYDIYKGKQTAYIVVELDNFLKIYGSFENIEKEYKENKKHEEVKYAFN